MRILANPSEVVFGKVRTVCRGMYYIVLFKSAIFKYLLLLYFCVQMMLRPINYTCQWELSYVNAVCLVAVLWVMRYHLHRLEN